jgi:hypothetical protein
MAYSPAQVMALSLVVFLVCAYMLRSGLRTGTFPRRYTPHGKEPVIRRENEPKMFRLNLWCLIIIMAVSAFGFANGLLLAINPNFDF